MHVISLREAEKFEARYYFKIAKDFLREGGLAGRGVDLGNRKGYSREGDLFQLSPSYGPLAIPRSFDNQ